MINPSNTIEYLGHILTYVKSKYVNDDYVCDNCNIRVHIIREKIIFKIINYVDEVKNGNISEKQYDLTCEEQIIKNLLE